jgi:hypothetical protein
MATLSPLHHSLHQILTTSFQEWQFEDENGQYRIRCYADTGYCSASFVSEYGEWEQISEDYGFNQTVDILKNFIVERKNVKKA